MMYAYADDSANESHVIYAGVVFSEDQAVVAEKRLADFKRGLNVPIDAELHCQVLFHGSKRDKSSWSNVTPEATESALRKLCEDLRAMSADPVSVEMPLTGPTAPHLGASNPMGVKEIKGVVTFGYASLHQDLLERYGIGGVRFWIDADTTKIPWAGGRRKAHLTREFFTASPGGSTPELVHPDRDAAIHPALIEIADFYAYSLANRGRGKRAAFWSEICQLAGLSPGSMVFASEPKWENVGTTPKFGNVMWRLHRGGETMVCRFKPMNEGFVWVEKEGPGELVTHEQRICTHPREIESAIQEFREKYLADGWKA